MNKSSTCRRANKYLNVIFIILLQSFWKSENVGLRLVGRGLATVDRFDKSLENKKLYKKYYADLLKAEDEALKKGEGMWEDKQKVDERSGILQRIKSRIWG